MMVMCAIKIHQSFHLCNAVAIYSSPPASNAKDQRQMINGRRLNSTRSTIVFTVHNEYMRSDAIGYVDNYINIIHRNQCPNNFHLNLLGLFVFLVLSCVCVCVYAFTYDSVHAYSLEHTCYRMQA